MVVDDFVEWVVSQPVEVEVEVVGILGLFYWVVHVEVFEDELKVSSQFVLQNTQEEVDNFPLDNDDEDALLNSHHFDLIELFEDEILLNLPLIPKHELKDCGSKDIVVMGVLAKDSLEIPSEEDQNTPSNPFARLKNLKFDA